MDRPRKQKTSTFSRFTHISKADALIVVLNITTTQDDNSKQKRKMQMACFKFETEQKFEMAISKDMY